MGAKSAAWLLALIALAAAEQYAGSVCTGVIDFDLPVSWHMRACIRGECVLCACCVVCCLVSREEPRLNLLLLACVNADEHQL